ncbi:MAG TPA: glycosyl hydrolase [candidate division Zixibacteria bacterium]|nr:glycosyl hydrolase [candidate division Zixibacteria bacterium]
MRRRITHGWLRNSSITRRLIKPEKYLLSLILVFIVSCAANRQPAENLPTLAPSAVPLADVPSPPATEEPTAAPTLPPTSSPLVLAGTLANTVAGQGEKTPVETPTHTPSPTRVPPSATPTLQLPAPIPTELPPTPTPSPTTRPPPNPPDEPWPAPTQHPYPVSSSPRHGVAVAFGTGTESGIRAEDYGWTYSWTSYVPVETSRGQHIPMLTGGPANGLPAFDTIVDLDARAEHNYWLVFNECEQHWQCDATPQEAADFYHDEVVATLYEQGADPDAKLIVGGVNAHDCGLRWLAEFMTYYEATYGPLPRAGWHFHIYPDILPNTWPTNCSGQWDFDDTLFSSPDEAFNLWTDRAHGILGFIQQYGSIDDEIWITEMGCLNHGFHQQQQPVCQESGFMAAFTPKILAWLNDEGRWVTRYAWYTNWDNNYWDATKIFSSVEGPWTFSSLGWFYTQILPASNTPWHVQ